MPSSQSVQGFDSRTGEELWHSEDPEPILSGPLRPTVAEGSVYVGDATGRVWSIDASTGEIEWRTVTSGAIVAPPAVDGDCRSRRVVVGTVDGEVHAIDAADGSMLWSSDLVDTGGDESATHGVLFQPSIGDSDVFVSRNDGALVAMDLETGTRCRILYEPTGLSWGDSGPPASSGDVVYYGARGGLSAFDATTGGDRWPEADSIRPRILHEPIEVGDFVLVSTTGDTAFASHPNSPVCGIEVGSGTVDWSREMYGSELDVVEDIAYTTAGGAATALAADFGEVLWRYPTGIGDLTATAEGIYAVGRNDDGTSTLYALDETDMT